MPCLGSPVPRLCCQNNNDRRERRKESCTPRAPSHDFKSSRMEGLATSDKKEPHSPASLARRCLACRAQRGPLGRFANCPDQSQLRARPQSGCSAAARVACVCQASKTAFCSHCARPTGEASPNQVLTLAARAAASQLNKVPFQAPPVAARGAREGLWSE